MIPALRPANDSERVESLLRYAVLDTLPERSLDDLTALAAHICEAPIALISLVDSDRQWFKSRVGYTETQTPRDESFCGHAILEPELFIVPDAARDGRFFDNPLVTGEPFVRFYAGAQLFAPDGNTLGTLCIMDRAPRDLTALQMEALRMLARQVMSQLELRRQTRELMQEEERLFSVFESCPVALAINRWSDHTFVDVNSEFTRLTGWSRDAVAGRTADDLNIVAEDVAADVRGRLQTDAILKGTVMAIKTSDNETRYALMGSAIVELRGEKHAITTLVDITERKLAERALRDSEARYRTLFENAPAGIVIADGEAYYTDANASMCEMLGYTRSELIGLHASDIVSAAEVRHIEPALTTIKARADYDRQWQFRRKDGSFFDAEVSATMMPDGNLLGVIRDITERNRAEHQIQHLNRVYAVLSDINQTIVRERDPQALMNAACRIAVEKGRFVTAWIGLVDPMDGEFKLASHAGASEEMLSTIREVLADKPRFESGPNATVLRTGRHVVCNDVATDVVAKSWRETALDRRYRSMATLPLVSGGAVVGTYNLYSSELGFFDEAELELLDELALDVGFAFGVHELEATRQRIGQSLRESEDRFRELAENIQEVFWMTDPVTGEILYISPAYETIWGRSCASLRESPQTALDAIHPEDRERITAAARTKAPRGDFDETYRIIRPDDTVRWIHERAFPIRDHEGKTLRVVGTAEDVTQSRQLEQQFRQSQKMEAIGQLAGGVAHDFNNILAAMMMQADLASAETNTPEETRELVGEIKAATRRAAELTRQLLAFSSRQVMVAHDLELNDVVTSLAKMLQRILGEDVALQLNLHPAMLPAYADRGMIDQVLLNLVVNARDAMQGGGRLSIETTERVFTRAEASLNAEITTGRYVGLRVIDTGTGIAPEVVPHIFEPFFTTKESGKGTGLGLATVFGIVKQHGGVVSVESKPGAGTTFEVLLPASEPAEPVLPEAVKPRALTGTETILLVEDEQVVRTLARVVLERAGYSVLEAGDGMEAVRVWDEQRDSIDLLLTDIVMPGGMNGRELASRLMGEDRSLKVVLSSGYSADIAGRELSLQSSQRFLQKPFSPGQLLETIRMCLEAEQPA